MYTVFLLRLNNYIIYIRLPFPRAYYCNAIRFMTCCREKPLSVAPAVCRGHLEYYCRFSTTITSPHTQPPGWSDLSTRHLYATSIFVCTYLPRIIYTAQRVCNNNNNIYHRCETSCSVCALSYNNNLSRVPTNHFRVFTILAPSNTHLPVHCGT